MKKQRDQVEQHLNEALEQRLERIPENIEGKLRLARKKALEQTGSGQDRFSGTTLWAGGAGVALASFVLIFLMLGPAAINEPLPTGDQELLEMISASDSLEFYEQLEFVQWLDEESSENVSAT